MEALFAGMPMVAVGPGLGNGPQYPRQWTYEAADLLDGLMWTDDMHEANTVLRQLLADDHMASVWSQRSVKIAEEHFGKEKIKKQWEDFLNV
jgi:hypothetical protein